MQACSYLLALATQEATRDRQTKTTTLTSNSKKLPAHETKEQQQEQRRAAKQPEHRPPIQGGLATQGRFAFLQLPAPRKTLARDAGELYVPAFRLSVRRTRAAL